MHEMEVTGKHGKLSHMPTPIVRLHIPGIGDEIFHAETSERGCAQMIEAVAGCAKDHVDLLLEVLRNLGGGGHNEKRKNWMTRRSKIQQLYFQYQLVEKH